MPHIRPYPRCFIALASLAALSCLAQSQVKPLTLSDALALAKQNNGTVRSAYLSFLSARSAAAAGFASFLPTVTPSFVHTDGQLNSYLGGGVTSHSNLGDNQTGVIASWRLLDNGTRSSNYNFLKDSAQADEYQALTTLRTVLFNVHQSYYNKLRADELLKVQDLTLERAKTILEQTKFRASPKIGDAPRKDILQANADALNARVGQLTAQNGVTNAVASLKAILGLTDEELPPLAPPDTTLTDPEGMELKNLMSDGIKNRPDLRATRLRVNAQYENLRAAKLNYISYALDATYSRNFGNSIFDQPKLQFQVTIPLYDGQRTKENVASANYSLGSLKATLSQSEKDVRAAIEADYKTLQANIERLTAAKAAQDAAELNFQAAIDSQRLGSSSLIDVLTAQVSLATAQSNYVQAYYDRLISDIQLRLDIGAPLPGQE